MLSAANMILSILRTLLVTTWNLCVGTVVQFLFGWLSLLKFLNDDWCHEIPSAKNQHVVHNQNGWRICFMLWPILVSSLGGNVLPWDGGIRKRRVLWRSALTSCCLLVIGNSHSNLVSVLFSLWDSSLVVHLSLPFCPTAFSTWTSSICEPWQSFWRFYWQW